MRITINQDLEVREDGQLNIRNQLTAPILKDFLKNNIVRGKEEEVAIKLFNIPSVFLKSHFQKDDRYSQKAFH